MSQLNSFWDIRDIVRRAEEPEAAWQALLRYVRQIGEGAAWDGLAKLGIRQEVDQMRRHLEDLWRREPVPEHIHVLYFGLFDAWDPSSSIEFAGYYVSGCPAYDPYDADSLCDQQYFPDGRFLRIELLDTVHAAAKAEHHLSDLLGHEFMFGAAAILAKFGTPKGGRAFRIFVGFDEGEAAEIT